MEKKRVSVQIEGRSYSLITTDDEKYVQKVANEVLSHIRKAAQSTKQLDTRDCAVLAALNFCDDRNKALKKNKDYVEKADKIIQQTNDLNRLCKEYREKLTEAMNDNTRLINNNKELEKRLAVLGHEVSQLKEKLQSVEKGKEKAESEKSEPEKNSVPKEKKTSNAKADKKADKKSKEKKARKNPFKSLASYFKSVGKEGKKVIWPTAKEVLKNTLVVLVVIIIVGVAIYVVDLGLTQGMKGIKSLATTSTTESTTSTTAAQTLEKTTVADSTTTKTTASTTKAAK